MAAQIDQHLQNTAGDAIEAIGDGTGLTATPAFTAALVELVGLVESQRAAHARAVAAAATDTTENRLAALRFDEAISEAIALTRHVRAVARLELVDLDPRQAAELGPIEVERRQRAYDAAFAHSPSELANLGRVNVRAALQATVDQLEAGSFLTKARRKHLADTVARVD